MQGEAQGGSWPGKENRVLLPPHVRAPTRGSNVQYADPRPAYWGNSGADRDYCTFECARTVKGGGFRRQSEAQGENEAQGYRWAGAKPAAPPRSRHAITATCSAVRATGESRSSPSSDSSRASRS